MADAPIWTPSPERAAGTNMAAFARTLRLGTDYASLHALSIAEPRRFWPALWDYLGIVGERGCVVVDDPADVEHARWFGEARLNFAENHLRRRDDGAAVIALDEAGGRKTLSWAELYDRVCRARGAMQALGIGPGDRVASMLPNLPETVVAMLAATSLGAIWSACAPEYGVAAIVDRFATIEPHLLLVADGVRYGGKAIVLADKNREVRAALPHLRATVEVGNLGHPCPADHIAWTTFAHASPLTEFTRFPFDTPALIVYSSGTTGKPKAIVHGAGSTLIATLKEMALHCDARPGESVFWPTNPGWMVWNVMIASLAWGAPIVLYDGSPTTPDPNRIFAIARQERAGILRVVPPLIDTYMAAGMRPADGGGLKALRCIVSGSAPLLARHYAWLYAAVKADLHVMSPAGGTDVMGTLASGNPMGPVYPGEIQCRSLGLAVAVWDDAGRPVTDEPGELVCTRAFPNTPLALFGEGMERLHDSYYARFPGVWRHGDRAEITARGGVIINGRADATLKIKGVRIGTAEIGQAIASIDTIRECAAVLHGERLILFVVLVEGAALDLSLAHRLRATIRAATTARHVPDAIVSVPDLLRSLNGKPAERAIADAVNGRPATGLLGLSNPELLPLFEAILRTGAKNVL